MAKFRYHRGGLKESMATVIEVSSKQDLAEKMEPDIFGNKPTAQELIVKPYGYDSRIDWDTYIVTVEGRGVFGYTDGPLE